MYGAAGYFYFAQLSKGLTKLDELFGDLEEPEEHQHEGTIHF